MQKQQWLLHSNNVMSAQETASVAGMAGHTAHAISCVRVCMINTIAIGRHTISTADLNSKLVRSLQSIPRAKDVNMAKYKR